MKSQSWYKKEYGLLWWMQYKLDQIAERDGNAATKRSKDNQKAIARNAKSQAELDKRFGR